jgi:cytochrome c
MGLGWPLLALVAAVALVTTAQAADPVRGEKVFKKCQSCHMVGPEARHKVGPHLNGLFDRKAAAFDDFKYSPAMRRAGADGLAWTTEALDHYIENPRSLVSGTRMAFRGIADAQDRADVIAFLRQFSASPRDIPEAEPTAERRDPDIDPAILAIEGDPAYGEYLAGECTTCHQADGEDKGIPSITGWPEEDFVVALHAYKQQYRPHQVMRLIAGALSDEEIAALAAYFKTIE